MPTSNWKSMGCVPAGQTWIIQDMLWKLYWDADQDIGTGTFIRQDLPLRARQHGREHKHRSVAKNGKRSNQSNQSQRIVNLSALDISKSLGSMPFFTCDLILKSLGFSIKLMNLIMFAATIEMLKFSAHLAVIPVHHHTTFGAIWIRCTCQVAPAQFTCRTPQSLLIELSHVQVNDGFWDKTFKTESIGVQQPQTRKGKKFPHWTCR